ncbi:MAG TPA: alpha/beta hydrolase-fold protein [Chitinophagaceae bacterium]|jgi:esterase/lipase superfamily enzyme|nr:alpha/beta hydrolase-fold protein [Chitinophagaceae bacterium]
MTREYYKWHSPFLNREMELLVFGNGGTPVLFFPTRTARFYDYENWKVVAAVEDKIDAGLLQLFCVDSVDIESFYANIHPADKIKRHRDYERYILYEVLRLIRHQNPNPLTVAGCSFGGYHAVNIAFRHPGYFSKVVGMSARYDLTWTAPQFADLLDGYFNDDIYFNMPAMFIPNLTDEGLLHKIRRQKIILAVGELDPFIENNRKLSDALTGKNIDHELIIWEEEAHRARYWRQMVQLYL